MAKRFTDTNKYKKPFIRGLQGAYKLLWDYLYHDCDHAGIWIVDFDIAQLYIGQDMPVNREDALLFFNAGEIRIVEIDNGSRWFIPSFVEFQYGELNELNRAHNSVIQELKKFKIFEDFQSKNFGLQKPLARGLQGRKDKDKDKLKEKEKENLKEKAEIEKNWRTDFEVFVHEIWVEFDKLTRDLKWIEDQERLNPGIDVLLSIEKSIKNFWATDEGWSNKKKTKTVTPDWKATFARTMHLNKVPKQKGSITSGDTRYVPKNYPDTLKF